LDIGGANCISNNGNAEYGWSFGTDIDEKLLKLQYNN
jgi:23S rRNA A1618 N6-methylase RlmF